MAARAYWSGQLRLALVSIPVQVFLATKSASRISFHQIHEPTGKRVRYQKVVPGHGPVEPDEIVKGYEVEKNRYVLLAEEEIDALKLEAKKTIDLVQFVDLTAIDPIYFDRPFFVKPEEDETAQEAYVTLREALRQTGKAGLGQIVVRGKSAIVAVKACHKGLLLEMLRYADEVRRAEGAFADVPDLEPDRELVGLAEELIGRKSGPFDPQVFKDAYTDAVRALIQAKLEKRQPEEIEAPQPSAQVIDLMEALKRSVAGDGKDASPGRSRGRREGERTAKPAKAKGKTKARPKDRAVGKGKRKAA